jgi:hypothetical protein
MPRPKGEYLDQLFGLSEPPRGWQQRLDYRMYFVHGVSVALAKVRAMSSSRQFLPLCDRLPAERAKSGWESGLPSDAWSDFSRGQVNRFAEGKNTTFTTAANGILAVELFLSDKGYTGDIYAEKLCYVVAQDSHITNFTREVFAELCTRASKAEKDRWEDCLCPKVHQLPQLFEELISGRLVTIALARKILTLIKQYIPTFDGRVSSDYGVRQESLKDLRQQVALRVPGVVGRRGTGKRGPYERKITGAEHEIYFL